MNLLPEYSATTLNRVHHCDALSLFRALPSGFVDCIVTDPPYMGVKDDDWDNQWKTRADYLDWLRLHLAQFQRVLKPNGSLYLFASPQMAAHVEVTTGDYFNVLNHIIWKKPFSRHNQSDRDALRGFFPQTERIIFAEQGGSDQLADEIAGFSQAETDLKRRIFGNYLKSEWDRAGVSYHQITGAIGAYNEHNHGGAASNWALGYNCPTPEQYHKMRDYLNGLNGQADYLRREYEDLRRPFNVTPQDAYTDVWTFRTVQAYDGKHVCEKPLDLMKHIIKVSSRPDALILDPFCGSGATLDAARQLGRHYIGCDQDAHWTHKSRQRLSHPFTLPMFADPQV